MKRIFSILLIVFIANTSFAQECKKTCKKDSYVVTDGLIKAKQYHDNGTIAQTGFYTTDNKLHGEWASFDRDGNRTAIAQYDKGAKVGIWYFFHNGEIKEVTFNESKINSVKTLSPTDTRVVSYR